MCYYEFVFRLPNNQSDLVQVLGPVIGGFLAASKGWRWTFWLLAILGGFCSVSAFVIMSETHPKVILERKTASLRADTGNHHLRSKLAGNPLSPHQVVVQVLIRPTVLLFRSPILFVISLYVALVFGVMYLLFTTFTSVFEGQYGFSTSVSGLVYLGPGFSLVASMLIFNILNNHLQSAQSKADGVQQHRPENRLLPMIWFSPLVSLGLFIYGWTAYYKVHWMVPIIGTALWALEPFSLWYVIDVYVPTQCNLLIHTDARATLSDRRIWFPGCCLCAWRQ